MKLKTFKKKGVYYVSFNLLNESGVICMFTDNKKDLKERFELLEETITRIEKKVSYKKYIEEGEKVLSEILSKLNLNPAKLLPEEATKTTNKEPEEIPEKEPEKIIKNKTKRTYKKRESNNKIHTKKVNYWSFLKAIKKKESLIIFDQEVFLRAEDECEILVNIISSIYSFKISAKKVFIFWVCHSKTLDNAWQDVRAYDKKRIQEIIENFVNEI